MRYRTAERVEVQLLPFILFVSPSKLLPYLLDIRYNTHIL
jgi:hypothetical protein